MLLFGYWEKNLGDDLILEEFIRNIRSVNKLERICILSKKQYKAYYNEMGCEVTCSDSFLYRAINRLLYTFRVPELFYRKCNNKENFVALGGSLFAEHLNSKVNDMQLCNLNYAVSKSKESYVIGSNFGPFSSEKHIQNYKKLFSRMKDVCFRDHYSVNIIGENCRFAPDVVLSMRNTNTYNVTNESFDLMIPVNVYDRNDLVDYADAYIDGLLAYIGYSKNKGRQVKILIFCEKENDNEICKKVFDRAIDEYGKESVELVRYVSTSQIVNLFINAHTIFATRFHAMILGLLFDKKVFPIIYSSKMKEALEDYCDNARFIMLSDFDARSAKESLEWSDFNSLNNNVIKDSQGQFKYVSNFCK